MEHLKAKVDGGSSSCVGPYHSAMAELAKLDLEAARGAQVCSRARWVEEGETSSAYFFRLEKKCGADRWISAIKLDDGTIVSSPTDLCAAFADFMLLCSRQPPPTLLSVILCLVTSPLLCLLVWLPFAKGTCRLPNVWLPFREWPSVKLLP